MPPPPFVHAMPFKALRKRTKLDRGTGAGAAERDFDPCMERLSSRHPCLLRLLCTQCHSRHCVSAQSSTVALVLAPLNATGAVSSRHPCFLAAALFPPYTSYAVMLVRHRIRLTCPSYPCKRHPPGVKFSVALVPCNAAVGSTTIG